jgi:crotonobetainyl-CoA:carnitine CoA-transferase CaiB-like acyl-CoA transferase
MEERFAGALARYRNRAALNALVEQWTGSRDKEALTQDLQERGIPAAPVRSPSEQIADPQLKSLGFFQMVEHSHAGTHPYASFPARFSGRYPSITRVGPLAGQDNRSVFEGLLGLSRGEIEELEAAEVIGPRQR